MKSFLMLAVFTALAVGTLGISMTMSKSALEKCLECICQASTKCVAPRQCWKVDNSDTLLCGKYLISEKFWNDAGRPFDKEVGGFFKCAYHDVCAKNTIISYVKKFPNDCDGNGEFNCLDVALLHHGEDACENPWERTTDYFKEIERCSK